VEEQSTILILTTECPIVSGTIRIRVLAWRSWIEMAAALRSPDCSQ